MTKQAPAPQTADAQQDDFGSLESALCDAANMAGILLDMVSALVTQKPPACTESHVYCNADDRNKLSFAAHETSARLAAIKERFYTILERDLAGKAKGGAA